MNIKWTNKEIQYLKDNYPSELNIYLSKNMNKTEEEILFKAKEFNLKKNYEHARKRIILYNKAKGRNLTYDALKNIALKYKTRGQFIHEDSSAYVSARKMKILDEICSHMISQSYSKPQLILKHITTTIFKQECLYNTRQIIKPYELDIYFKDLNLAFEYNGKGWHKENDENDLRKMDICKKANIHLFYIIENNRNYEEDVKNQLINLLPQLNNILSMNILPIDIESIKIDYNKIYDSLIDKESIKHTISKYTLFSDFKKNENKIHNKLSSLNLLEEYTSHLKQTRIYWNLEKLEKCVCKYIYLQDFIDNDKGCYQHILRHKEQFGYLLKPLKYRNKKNLN